MDTFQRQYRSSLQDLTFNSKPIITNLTIIADENEKFANIVVAAVEDRIRNVSNFAAAFAVVDQNEKESLKKLIHTWRTHPGGYLFPSHVIGAVEKEIAKPPAPAQVPQRVNQVVPPPVQHRPPYKQPTPQPPSSFILSQSALVVQKQLSTVIAQKKASLILNPSDPDTLQQIKILEDLYSIVSTTALEDAVINQIAGQIRTLAVSNANQSVNIPPARVVNQPAQYPPYANYQVPTPAFPSYPPTSQYPAPVIPPLPVKSIGVPSVPFISSSLLSGLSNIDANLLKSFNSPTTIPASLVNDGTTAQNVSNIPIINLTTKDIQEVRVNLWIKLYDEIDLQCKQCALRFKSINDGKTHLEAHLDWHFRQKRRQKEKSKKTISRDWYISEADWLTEEPIDVVDQHVAPVFFSSKDDLKSPVEEVSIIPAGDQINKCNICHESLEKYFDAEHDDWMLRNTVKINEKLYHQTCYQDKPAVGTPILGKRTLDADQPDSDKKIKVN
ncbi:hypothetical protein HDV02_001551 [Globomyces sp. JEL0801]|nr:hypothetical protein HDV02_001551 [Globomyces sp. JEL0801]